MKILLDILKDSKAHYLDVQSNIQKRLDVIPRGSVFKCKPRQRNVQIPPVVTVQSGVPGRGCGARGR